MRKEVKKLEETVDLKANANKKLKKEAAGGGDKLREKQLRDAEEAKRARKRHLERAYAEIDRASWEPQNRIF